MPPAAPLLSLLIPAYNERARLGRTLAQVLTYLGAQPYAAEVLVIDDGSTDGTAAVAEEFFATHAVPNVQTRVLAYQPNRGKGHAVRQGLLAARGQVVVFSDADLSTPIEELPRLLTPLAAGAADVVFGSRALDRSLIGTHQPWAREWSGRFFNRVMRWATGLPYHDTQCGFKGFRGPVAQALAQGARLDRFGFDVELLLLAHRAGLRLREVPVRWNDAPGSKVGLSGGLGGFRELQELRRRVRRGEYAATLARLTEAAKEVVG